MDLVNPSPSEANRDVANSEGFTLPFQTETRKNLNEKSETVNVSNSYTMLKPEYLVEDRNAREKQVTHLDAMINVEVKGEEKTSNLTNHFSNGDATSGRGNETSVDGREEQKDLKRVEIKVLSGQGSKFWIAGLINDEIVTAFADSAADISLFPKDKAEGMIRTELEKPFEVSGFRGKESVLITHTVEVVMDFKPGILKTSFYLCDTRDLIIGSDILQDRDKKVSLHTGDRCFEVDDYKINTSRTESAARKEYNRRNKLGVEQYLTEFEQVFGAPLMRSTGRVYLPPQQCIDIKAVLSGKNRLRNGDHSLLSYFDQGEGEIFVPSLTFRDMKVDAIRSIPITNLTRNGFWLPSGFVIGEAVTHSISSSGPKRNYCEIYNVDEVRRQLSSRDSNAKDGAVRQKDRIIINAVSKASTSKVTESNAAEAEEAGAASKDKAAERPSGPVLFSDLVGVNKHEQAIFDQCREYGVQMDYDLEQTRPNVHVNEIKEPDYKAERLKAEQCPYWPDKAKFLEQFELSHIDAETRVKIEELLWAYRHIWYADDHPEQFRKGLQNCQPVIIRRIAGAIPKKVPSRQLSGEKLKMLQQHLDSLQSQGVIVPYEDGQWASPVHIVLEERYSAKHGKNIHKARVTIDLRNMNAVICPLAYPIPNCEEFRRDMAQYSWYSCVDGKAWFHQILVNSESSKECFCISAAGRIWRMVRLCMGAKVSPSIAQCLVDLMFKNHDNCRAYLDDFTTFSHNLEDHLKHLEKTFGLCSYYNMLLAPNKAHLATQTMRNLGFQVASKETSMCSEKIDKIKGLIFPEDKKQLISTLAFFQFFNRVAPKLSEYTAPLRRLALPNVRFKPDASHVEAFEKARAHLMDSNVTAIRAPSQKLEDLIYLFCDASCSAIGCVLTQMQQPDDNAKAKELYLIGTFSSVVPEIWENFPPWLLELIALWETTRKYRWLLLGRNFIVCSDSATVKSWSNLELIPKDLSRKILALQQFSFKILFLESRMNPSDLLSRAELPLATENRGCYQRFMEGRIINAKGEIVPVESLFCAKKAQEIADFFTKTRKQQMSRAISSDQMKEKKNQEYQQMLYDSKYEQDDSTLLIDSSSISVDVIDFDTEEEFRAVVPEVPQMEQRADLISVAAVDLDDQELAEGRAEIMEDVPLINDMPSSLALPTYNDQELSRITAMQTNDNNIKYILGYLKGTIVPPGKIEVMAQPSEIRDFIRHRSNFRLNSQNVLMRVWIDRKGNMTPLIVVGTDAFQKLLSETHNFNPGSGRPSIPHLGQNRTFSALSGTFYTFKMREKVAKFVSSCPVCHLDNHLSHGMKEDKGEQISFEPLSLMIVDYLGPLSGWASTSTGSPRYVFLMIDAATRFLITVATKDVGDDETFRAVLEARKQLCGLPKRIASDDAIFREHSAARKYLEEAGVSIIHGKASISRDQSKVERAISTLTRTICKLHTEVPSASFERILSEATLAQNSAITRGTGKSPRELHFVRSPSTFLNVEPKDVQPGKRSLKEAVSAARAAGREVLQDEVRQFIKRNENTSPTAYTKRLVKDDLVLKRRTSFPLGSPRKLCHKTSIDCYRVVERVASNSYRVISIIDNSTYIYPGDLLVRLRHHDIEDARKLVDDMRKIVERNSARSAATRMATRSGRPAPSIAALQFRRRLEQTSSLGPPASTGAELWLGKLFENTAETKTEAETCDDMK